MRHGFAYDERYSVSMLQSMDAGIIASFKCHFRKRQLRYAIDQLENGKHPYKVDQFTAMRWYSMDVSISASFH